MKYLFLLNRTEDALRDRAQAVVFAYESGVIQPEG
jgi:hypothetical protein